MYSFIYSDTLSRSQRRCLFLRAASRFKRRLQPERHFLSHVNNNFFLIREPSSHISYAITRQFAMSIHITSISLSLCLGLVAFPGILLMFVCDAELEKYINLLCKQQEAESREKRIADLKLKRLIYY